MNPLIEAAISSRSSLRQPGTDAFRLIDGEGDGFPGLFLEEYAGKILLSSTHDQLPKEMLAWLRKQEQTCYLKRLRQDERSSPDHLCGPRQEAPFLISENQLRFEISFQSGYSHGIFLDQRDNRKTIAETCGNGMTVLNTFAYTGAFSAAAASAGATTTTLDLSAPYLEWAKRNFRHNNIDPSEHYFCKGDTFHWLRRFAKQGRKFDLIILDPPTFSRDEKGRVFRVEKHFDDLARLAASALSPGGSILCCTNFRSISEADFIRLIRAKLIGSWKTISSPMPSDFTAPPYLKSIWLRS